MKNNSPKTITSHSNLILLRQVIERPPQSVEFIDHERITFPKKGKALFKLWALPDARYLLLEDSLASLIPQCRELHIKMLLSA